MYLNNQSDLRGILWRPSYRFPPSHKPFIIRSSLKNCWFAEMYQTHPNLVIIDFYIFFIFALLILSDYHIDIKKQNIWQWKLQWSIVNYHQFIEFIQSIEHCTCIIVSRQKMKNSLYAWFWGGQFFFFTTYLLLSTILRTHITDNL